MALVLVPIVVSEIGSEAGAWRFGATKAATPSRPWVSGSPSPPSSPIARRSRCRPCCSPPPWEARVPWRRRRRRPGAASSRSWSRSSPLTRGCALTRSLTPPLCSVSATVASGARDPPPPCRAGDRRGLLARSDGARNLQRSSLRSPWQYSSSRSRCSRTVRSGEPDRASTDRARRAFAGMERPTRRAGPSNDAGPRLVAFAHRHPRARNRDRRGAPRHHRR